MNEFQASTEQRELPNNKLEGLEVTDIAKPISDDCETTGLCEKRQLLLDEIEKLKIYRDNHLSEAKSSTQRCLLWKRYWRVTRSWMLLAKLKSVNSTTN